MNVLKKYQNTWTYDNAINTFKYISSFCRHILTNNHNYRKPFLSKWKKLGLTQIHFHKINWYFGFKNENSNIKVYKCEHGDCMHEYTDSEYMPQIHSAKSYYITNDAGFGFKIVKSNDNTFNYIKNNQILCPNIWFKNVKLFKKTPYGIFAFVNNNDRCYAIDSYGALYDMGRTWNDCFTEGKIKKMIMIEAINKISNKNVIHINETELKSLIKECVKRIINEHNKLLMESYKPICKGYEFTDENGIKRTSVISIQDNSGQMCHIAEDDNCYLLFNDNGTGKNCSYIKWIFPELLKILQTLPLP